MPSEFGEVSFALLVTNFVAMISGAGLAQALIQRPAIDRGHKDAAFWVGLHLGIVLFVITALMAPLIALVYPEYDDLTWILVLSGLVFPFTAVTSVQSSLLRRELAFRTVARIELFGGTLMQATASVLLAMAGLGAFAVVLGQLARIPVTTLLYFRATRYKPSLPVDRAKLRELLSFGGNLTVAGFVDNLAFSIDGLLMPKLLGAGGMAAFGLYSWSNRLVTFPLYRIATAVTAVGFSAFSRIQGDVPRMRSAYLRMVACIAVTCFPMMAGLACLAEEFVTAFFRAEWHDTVPLIRILCVMGAMLAVGTTVGTIFQSRGRVDLEWKANLLETVVATIALILAPRDMISMTIVLVAVRLVMAVPMQAMANRLIGLRNRTFYRTLVAPAALSLLMAAVIAGTTSALAGLGPTARLAAGTATGSLVYAVALRFLTPGLWSMLKELASRRRRTEPEPEQEPATPGDTKAVPTR
jgi:PST family polysaccharide transporter